MSNCSNCSSSNPQYHLCSNCYENIFKSLYCDGHCGRKCDPSQRTGNNIIALPWWWYCETCRKKRENPNLPPDQKNALTDEIDRLKKKLEALEKQNENWRKENEKLEKVTEAFKGTYHDYRFKLENFYDIIVDIDSLRHMIKGWKVKFTEIGKKNYDIMKDKEVLIVGVVGNRNRGKSFVLSKLSNVNLPDGTSIKTEGISIKYPKMEEGKEAKYILMDSAGFENALLETDEFTNDPNIPREDALKMLKLIESDKTLTEYFIQNFIIQKSNVLIVVIGILNYPEQKLLNRIKTENKNKFKHKDPPPLFVIHNLQTFSLKKQVEDYIKETLTKSATFKLKEKKSVALDDEKENPDQNKIYFIEEFNNEEDKDTVIYHLILAMHGTEAGDYYNDFAYDFLSKQFNSFPIHHKFPIIEDVKQQCMNNSYKMMVHPIESLEEFEKSESEIKLISKDKEEDQKRLVFKRCLVDKLGFSNFYGANFDPKYAYFKTIIDKKPYVCIQVEIPGEAKVNCRAEIAEGNWNVTVIGNKMIKMNETEDKHTSFSKREEGDFNLLIKLNVEDFQLKENHPDKTKTTKENGLYSYYFPLIGGQEDSDEE